MIDIIKMFWRTISHFDEQYDSDNEHWQDIKTKIWKKLGWNALSTVIFLMIAAAWHLQVRPVELRSWGILLVGIGAVRLALISARVHARNFYDSSHQPEAVKDRKTTEYRPRVAGNVVDAVSGFTLVAIGFGIRVAAEFV